MDARTPWIGHNFLGKTGTSLKYYMGDTERVLEPGYYIVNCILVLLSNIINYTLVMCV